MNHFGRISDALRYIDRHLDQKLSVEEIAEMYHYSTYYFHRLFTAVVGKPLAAYVRDRRILYASRLLSESEQTILSIALECGYDSAQGVSPKNYRKEGYHLVMESPEEMVKRFTNRLKGGVFVQPNLFKRETMLIAGVEGDGSKTAQVWKYFMELSEKKPLKNLASDDGYDSENQAMSDWLETNEKGYKEHQMKDGSHYCVEHYDERFSESDETIVEIWIPIEKRLY